MKITALIPAFNEEKTIGKIVTLLYAREDIDMVLVVDDGSADRTAELAENSGAIVLQHSENQGKGAAIQAGIDFVSTDLFLFLDGDLVGLKDRHITRLLEPVLAGNADMSVGIFNEGRFFSDLAQKITPDLSGQRVIKVDILQGIEDLKEVGYGVELILNRYVKSRGKVEFIELTDLTHIMKEGKRGFLKGVLARAKMYWDLLKVLF